MYPIYNTILLIDDDPVQNHLNGIIIRKYLHPHTAEIIIFTNPEKGFDYLKEKKSGQQERILLLIDINMPILSGWQLLDKIAKLEAPVRHQFTIFILSSSIDPADKQKALASPLVRKMVSKPLSDHLEEIFGE